jgi:predicted esterase
MPSWYDIHSLDNIDQDQDEKGMLESSQKSNHCAYSWTLEGIYNSVRLNSLFFFHLVMQIIREEVEVNQIPANRIAIGGFSQGCVMGLLTGLTSEYKFGGIVSLSGYMPLHNKIMNRATDSNKKTPIFWGHGDVDQIVLYEYGKRSVELLQKHKYDVRFHTYPRMAHSSCPQEIRDLISFLKEVLPPPPQEATTSTTTA